MTELNNKVTISTTYRDELSDSIEIDGFDASIHVNESTTEVTDSNSAVNMELTVAVNYSSHVAEYVYEIDVDCDRFGELEDVDTGAVDIPNTVISLDNSDDYDIVVVEDGVVEHQATSKNIARVIDDIIERSAYIIINY